MTNEDPKQAGPSGGFREEPIEREVYLEERKSLIEAEREAAQSLDKTLVTLSAGALGLSITFIRQIAPEPEHLWVLYVGWGGFSLSLLAVLSSFLFSQFALRRARQNLDLISEGEGGGGNPWAGATNVLNFVSILTFVAGILFLAAFAITNVGH